MDHVLIDTDVVLDFFFDRMPFAEYATQIFNLCEQGKIKGYVTPVIISNVYYLLSKNAKHNEVISKLKQLLTILEISEIKKHIILEALNSKFKCFEVALQNYSAENNKLIKILLTRNTKDYKESNLAIISPEMYLKQN
jgi:predicted nucleic acid-binding protein